MVKLIAIYSRPADTAAFDKHYAEVHTPLAKKMPGLRRIDISRSTGSPMGEARYYQIAELSFDSKEALDAAMKSPEGKAAAKDLMTFAGTIVHLLTADVLEL